MAAAIAFGTVWEGGLNRVADTFEMDTALGRDRLAKEREVALDGRLHRLLIGLPALGAALDVREEKGDSSTGVLGHGRLRGCCAVASVVTTLGPAQREV